MTEAKNLLAAARLVTLTGAGGVGKTRLALQVAATMRQAFEDGAWFVDLGQLRDPAMVADHAAVALEVPDLSGRPPLTALAEHLAGRRLLMVLDNCEHLLDGCALVAETLLRNSPGLRILATSREPLGVSGEAV
ncbi:MAG TPA: AAA family ATPase, partial [Candidatus Dormibacteraeota bacterium]